MRNVWKTICCWLLYIHVWKWPFWPFLVFGGLVTHFEDITRIFGPFPLIPSYRFKKWSNFKTIFFYFQIHPFFISKIKITIVHRITLLNMKPKIVYNLYDSKLSFFIKRNWLKIFMLKIKCFNPVHGHKI